VSFLPELTLPVPIKTSFKPLATFGSPARLLVPIVIELAPIDLLFVPKAMVFKPLAVELAPNTTEFTPNALFAVPSATEPTPVAIAVPLSAGDVSIPIASWACALFATLKPATAKTAPTAKADFLPFDDWFSETAI
jgi:hypothetical protein